MLEPSDISRAVEAYQQTMTSAMKAARDAVLPDPVVLQFCTQNLVKNDIKSLSQLIPTGGRKEDKGSEFIYVFSVGDSCDVQFEQIENAFDAGRELQAQDDYPGDRNLCQLNALSQNTNAIYVGRSYSPRERFKQHLLESPGETYAIHFQTWASELHLHVNMHIYQFRELGDLAAQVIEDGLWDHLQPLLGKRGAK